MAGIGFLYGSALLALGGLVVLYWLLRLLPPRPQILPFPPLRLLQQVQAESIAAKIPWWLLALRLISAAAIIIAMAGPILDPLLPGNAKNPLLVLIDDDWGLAEDWGLAQDFLAERLQEAEKSGRPIALLNFSSPAPELTPQTPATALRHAQALQPQPFLPQRNKALPAITQLLRQNPQTEILWLSDGLDRPGENFQENFVAALTALAPVSVTSPVHLPLALAQPLNLSAALQVNILRPSQQAPQTGIVRALDAKGRLIATEPFDLGAQMQTSVSFTLPLELRDQMTRLDIANQKNAGSVALLDERWRRRRIGIVSGESTENNQPLIAPTYYLSKAVATFAQVDLAQGDDPIARLIEEKAALILVADLGAIPERDKAKLEQYIQQGGIVVRFASPKMALGEDHFSPVRLRRSDRVLGGSLSWDSPKNLSPFSKDSPFFGLDIPKDVTVSRQILAEPDPGLDAKTWAALADGTPIVTYEPRGKGMLVLFHMNADASWSNLPLSGLFVDMLHRLSDLAHPLLEQHAPNGPIHAGQSQTLAPHLLLDGFGAFISPPATAQNLPKLFQGAASLEHPPGFYGPEDALVAVEPLAQDARLQTLDLTYPGLTHRPLSKHDALDLRPVLLLIALIGFLLDGVLTLWLGKNSSLHLQKSVAGALALIVTLASLGLTLRPARAQTSDPPPQWQMALTTRLAFVASGDGQIDSITRLGLSGLSNIINTRTSMDIDDPVAVDPAVNELAFYPLIYWPIDAQAKPPSDEAIIRLNHFMQHGGTIIFDTRDATGLGLAGQSPQARWLKQLLARIDVPELEAVPADHVLTKSFYLIHDFPGRYNQGQTWIEVTTPNDPSASRPVRMSDSVSPVIIASNDLAAAWAVSEDGLPLVPLSSDDEKQREWAFRGGVNLVIYTMTGTYKSDQVHVRELLQRLAH